MFYNGSGGRKLGEVYYLEMQSFVFIFEVGFVFGVLVLI